jgi:hypothetical protein
MSRAVSIEHMIGRRMFYGASRDKLQVAREKFLLELRAEAEKTALD